MIRTGRVTRRSAVTALATAGVGAALGVTCRPAPATDHTSTAALDAVAEGYVRTTLALALHQPSLVEAWRGPSGWRPGPRRPVAALRDEIDGLRAAMAAIAVAGADAARGAYLRQQLEGLLVAARRLAGETMTVADEASAALGGDVAAMIAELADERGAAAAGSVEARRWLNEHLPGTGALHRRYAAFRARHALAPEKVAPAITAARDVCRRRVRRVVALPEAEEVRFEPATALGLEAEARYDGAWRSRVLIDLTGAVDVARVLWLVAHEAYPGHHVQHVLAEQAREIAGPWPERALWPSFGRHLLCAEGAAEAGAALLFEGDGYAEAGREVADALGVSGQAVSEVVAVHRAVAVLDQVIVATGLAYLDGQMGSGAAVERLERDGLVLAPAHLLALIERQRSRLMVYPVGRRLVWAALGDLGVRSPNIEIRGQVSNLSNLSNPSRWARLTEIATLLILPPPAV